MFNYQALWVTLAKHGIKKTDLLKDPGLSSKTLAKLGKNEDVSMDVLNKLCNRFNCSIEEVITHIPDMPD